MSPRGSLREQGAAGNVFPGDELEGNNVGSVELQGHPEPEDVRDGTEKSPVSSSDDAQANRRRRVVLHQGLSDPSETESTTKPGRHAKPEGQAGG